MIADHPLNIGKWVALHDHLERLVILSPSRMVHVAGNILADRAGGHAGGLNAVESRQRPGCLDVFIGKALLFIGRLIHHRPGISLKIIQFGPCRIAGFHATGHDKFFEGWCPCICHGPAGLFQVLGQPPVPTGF